VRRIRSLRRLYRIWIVFCLDEYVAAGRWLLLPVWYDGAISEAKKHRG
jgi:hypothetical protein